MKRFASTLILVSAVHFLSPGQMIPDPSLPYELKNEHWQASWVRVPGSSMLEYGVYFFRNTLQLDAVPDDFIIHISADNRYKLYVNGEWVGLGPARGDADNWPFETYDLSPFLVEGENTVAAEVWNAGEYKPWAQVSLFTGLIVQGNDQNSSVLNTPGIWKCTRVDAIRPLEVDRAALGTFIIVGPGDSTDGRLYPWGWKSGSFDDSGWLAPRVMYPGSPKGVGTDITHALVPRTIPAMELSPLKGPNIRQVNGQDQIRPVDSKLERYRVAPNSRSVILLDQGSLVTAYPRLHVSGGEDACITLSYAEALFDSTGSKHHRDSITGMLFRGNSDRFLCDGGADREFTTLWFRTYRYIQLEIQTGERELTLEGYEALFTAYPFEEKAFFRCNEPAIDRLWQTGWRTARLCANETYYDCPYYEQMQYVGDTRIQALLSLYISGDDRLMRKAISDFYHSIQPEGLTQSRYPSEPRQVIPTYSLFWISMIHDYLWYRNDYLFAGQYLSSIQRVLQWFENRIDPVSGMIGPLEYWPFADWAKEWPWDNDKRIGGVPPGGQEGNSSIITLQVAMTLDEAADIFSFFGLEQLAAGYLEKSDQLIEATRRLCWDENRKLFADSPEKNSFSQHANAFAILCKAIRKEDRALFMENILRDPALIQASLYFRYYINRAAIEAGLGNKYLEFLGPWYRMIDEGLSTFAEIPDTESTRSDCHAWSASPLVELLSTVAGIRPAGAGFGTLIIEPHPGELKWIQASVPHFMGNISIDLKFRDDGSVTGKVSVPPGLKGVFIWDKQTIDLAQGTQKISMEPMKFRFRINNSE